MTDKANPDYDPYGHTCFFCAWVHVDQGPEWLRCACMKARGWKEVQHDDTCDQFKIRLPMRTTIASTIRTIRRGRCGSCDAGRKVRNEES